MSTSATSDTKIQELEAELATKNETIAKLQKDLATFQKLQAELAATHKDIAKLTKENTKLKGEKVQPPAKQQPPKSERKTDMVASRPTVAEQYDETSDFAKDTWLL